MELAAFQPVLRQSLAADVAERISQIIQSGTYPSGARLPAISEMARQFGVAFSTVREALKKLETVGVVEIRHGSGVYVGRFANSPLLTTPVADAAVSKQLVVDLMETRIPIELQTVALAARNATEQQLTEMGELLDEGTRTVDDPELLVQVNCSFHCRIAVASGNVVMHQILDVLSSLLRREQRRILGVRGRQSDSHREHVEIHEVLCARDPELAVDRMRTHLEHVRDAFVGAVPPETHCA
ncbi:MAG TPA: FadR/GntR family transcriptional regulator [Gemmatimonadaceae bacterium]